MLKVDCVSSGDAALIAQDAERRKSLVTAVTKPRMNNLFEEQLEIGTVAAHGVEDYKLEFGDVVLVGEEQDHDGSIVWTLVYLY